MEDSNPKIVMTDVLKVEIFDMACIDLSRRFCYRIVEPIPMIWQNDGRVTHMLTVAVEGKDLVAEQMLYKYRNIIEESKKQGMWHESLAWLENVDKVNITVCELTPKSEYQWSELSKAVQGVYK